MKTLALTIFVTLCGGLWAGESSYEKLGDKVVEVAKVVDLDSFNTLAREVAVKMMLTDLKDTELKVLSHEKDFVMCLYEGKEKELIAASKETGRRVGMPVILTGGLAGTHSGTSLNSVIKVTGRVIFVKADEYESRKFRFAAFVK